VATVVTVALSVDMVATVVPEAKAQSEVPPAPEVTAVTVVTVDRVSVLDLQV
jgi:hypothetical protein